MWTHLYSCLTIIKRLPCMVKYGHTNYIFLKHAAHMKSDIHMVFKIMVNYWAMYDTMITADSCAWMTPQTMNHAILSISLWACVVAHMRYSSSFIILIKYVPFIHTETLMTHESPINHITGFVLKKREVTIWYTEMYKIKQI